MDLHTICTSIDTVPPIATIASTTPPGQARTGGEIFSLRPAIIRKPIVTLSGLCVRNCLVWRYRKSDTRATRQFDAVREHLVGARGYCLSTNVGKCLACTTNHARSNAMIASTSADRVMVPVNTLHPNRSSQEIGFGPNPFDPRPADNSRNQAQTCAPSAGRSGPSSAAGRRPVWRSTLSSCARCVVPSGVRRASANWCSANAINSSRQPGGSFPGR